MVSGLQKLRTYRSPSTNKGLRYGVPIAVAIILVPALASELLRRPHARLDVLVFWLWQQQGLARGTYSVLSSAA